MSRVFVHDGANVREIALDDLCNRPARAGFSWIHFDRDDNFPAIAGRVADIPVAAMNAMTASETRPRCTVFGDGALINLRGRGEQDAHDADPLVSLRIWAQSGRVITLSYRRLGVIDDVMDQMRGGTLNDPGDVIAALAVAITDALDPDIAALGDQLDAIESAMDDTRAVHVRAKVSRIRATAISYRRFIAPQRQAVERLTTAQTSWLEADDRLHLQEAADRCARMAEELEAVRERAALTHEGLTDLRAEHMNRQALILAIVALIFLPLTFITGLLGMNVQGIPYAHAPWAFWGVVGFCAAVAVGVGGWFVATNWLQR